MEEILSKVLYIDFPKFREMAIQRLHWTNNQWRDRLSGRVKLKESERIILEDLYHEIQGQSNV